MQDNTSESSEVNNTNFQGIDPSKLSIRMSIKNSFLFPCSTCGSIVTRLPFEVVDQDLKIGHTVKRGIPHIDNALLVVERLITFNNNLKSLDAVFFCKQKSSN
jgi:hypothetical protein